MIDWRPILLIIGFLVCATGVAMLVPSGLNYAQGFDGPEPFSIAAAVAFFIGGLLILSNRGKLDGLSLRQAYVLTVLAWVTVPAISAFPLAFSTLGISYTDAFFETMSGLTTTGSTVLSGLDTMDQSILLWRALLQWLGGIGIVVMAIALLPFISSGGMQLFRTESSDRSEKPVPRMGQLAVSLIWAYLLLTALNTFAYAMAGMDTFDAVAHAMTTVSTAGYSTSDSSIGNFSPLIQWIAVVFMITGAIPFVLYIRAARGDWRIFTDGQVRAMLKTLAVFILLLTWWLWAKKDYHLGEALRLVALNVTSVMTTTGYASGDFGEWGGFSIVIFLLLMCIGGCTGSTTGAIKIFRFRVMAIILREQVVRRFLPHSVCNIDYDGRPLTPSITEGVMAFMVLYGMSIAIAAVVLGALGLDWVTSLSGAAQAVGNIGPGIGPVIGPSGNFSSLPDSAKWVLTFCMLLGRLELFTVLVLFVPRFWRG